MVAGSTIDIAFIRGLVSGEQSDSLSSNTSGNKSSSEMKLVASSSGDGAVSEVRRGQDGYAHEGERVLDSVDAVGDTEYMELMELVGDGAGEIEKYIVSLLVLFFYFTITCDRGREDQPKVAVASCPNYFAVALSRYRYVINGARQHFQSMRRNKTYRTSFLRSSKGANGFLKQ